MCIESTSSLSEGVENAVRVLQAVEAIRPGLKRIMASFHLPPPDAEDLAQDLIVLALSRGGQAVCLERWLLGVARKLCLMRRRAAQNRERRELAAAGDLVCLPPQEREDISRDLERGLACLPQQYQEVLRLRLSGCSSREIAAQTGYHPGSLRKLVKRCTERMACALVPTPSPRSS